MKPLVLAFAEDAVFAGLLARRLDGDLAPVDTHQFPDGEVRVRIAPCAGRRTVIVCGGQAANARALPLYFAAVTARELGATSVGLVSPYLAYMRQDKRFHEGESLSALAYARFLSAAFDWLVTVDPHLHRLGSLAAAFGIPATQVSAMDAVIPWVASHVTRPLIVGPDAESEQWARRVAAGLGAPFAVLRKDRRGDQDVRIVVPDLPAATGRTPVIIDDIASSGRTLARTIEALVAAGAAAPVCVIVHALFAGDAERVVRAAGATRVVSSNTIAHPTNGIDVSAAVAAAVRDRLDR